MSHKFGEITLREYQGEGYEKTVDYIRQQITKYKKDGTQPEPAIFSASVGAGKTLSIGAIASHCSAKNLKCLIIARQGELIRQNSDAAFAMGAPTSVYSASLNSKSVHYNTVAATEGTIVNSLDTDFADWLPLIIQIDEAHMCDWEDMLNGGQSQFARILRHFNMLADRRQSENPSQLIPRPIIIGYTGTPYRGTESIIGPYWKEQICDVGREFLVGEGFLVPTVFGFGHDDISYDYKGFDDVDEVGTNDFSKEQLAKMYEQADKSTTHKIMAEVMKVMEKQNLRNGHLLRS